MADSDKSNIVMSPVFRVAFPKVFTADKDGKFKMCCIFPAGTDLTALNALVQPAAIKKFGGELPKGIRGPWRKGEDKAGDYEGFEAGMTYINVSSKFQPRIVDANVQPIINPKDFYAGCWARATLNAFGYAAEGNKGVSFGMSDIQKVRDDKPFAGRPEVSDVFKPVEGTAAPAAAADDSFLS
jgi:hypothetical protein